MTNGATGSSSPAISAAGDPVADTPQQLRECPDCGLFQTVPPLQPGVAARCMRCNAVLRRTHPDSLAKALALNVAALGLLAIACGMTLMTVSTAGMYHSANLFTGPEGLQKHGVWELSVVVLFTTVAAPLLKLGCMTYVLLGLRLARPPRHLRTVFAWVEHLRPWSMIEVYLLGVFVAYVKLSDMVHIDIGVALYALGFLLLTMVAADAVLDRQLMWEDMARRGIPEPDDPEAALPVTVPTPGALACDTCGQVSRPGTAPHPRCPRCGSRLEHRKPNSLARTWALTLAAAVLYIPANIYPVLTVIQLGAGAPSTILGGAEELLNGGMWPLAALVFFASIAVPCLKLVGLTVLLTSTHLRATGRLRDRTVLYRIVNAIGRWSMIDIFMESILVALVQFGSVVTIDPGFGAVAFAAVVIITMFAAEGFDPRLMWDAAAERLGEPGQLVDLAPSPEPS